MGGGRKPSRTPKRLRTPRVQGPQSQLRRAFMDTQPEVVKTDGACMCLHWVFSIYWYFGVFMGILNGAVPFSRGLSSLGFVQF